MTCDPLGSCFACTLAGLTSCPFKPGAGLPLVEAEKPKVTHTRNVVYPPYSKRIPTQR